MPVSLVDLIRRGAHHQCFVLLDTRIVGESSRQGDVGLDPDPADIQAYYQSDGYPQQGASAISWIGSLQLFLQFSVGAFAGPLYDRGYFRWLILAGSVLLIVWYVNLGYNRDKAEYQHVPGIAL